MIEVGELEAGAHLSSLLDKVAKGEEVLITRRDKAVARLVPVVERDRKRIRATIDRLLEHRETTSLGGGDWKALRDEGRR
ncbi:MAG TPA: type II toxin-antitoxin system prevent-host-death family antitoxin [Ensifer sp.]|nr:type II toxin-antitoxin system prevent-host-death family antitoxin [Ensifer sp.]